LLTRHVDLELLYPLQQHLWVVRVGKVRLAVEHGKAL
jgi:hypothetical protein